jgi:hypothetical protein
MKKLIVFSSFLVIAVSAACQSKPQKKVDSPKKALATDTSSKKQQPGGFNVTAIQQQNTHPTSQGTASQNSFLPKPGKEKNTSAGNSLKKAAGFKKN